MATRDVVVRLRAEIGAFKRDMETAAKAAKKTADETTKAGEKSESGIGRLAQAAKVHEKAWGQVSNGMVASGTAVVGALGLATKAAIGWESAWAGVTKTVDGTPEQMAELEGGLRGLARTLPATHAEIAGVAEAAGQLGVAREDVLSFTKTMIDLGESTNLTAEDAATNIAQIANVMGTAGDDIGRFGASLVALGNDGASTESEILSMAQRIAGAGATVGATETDVLALSNALASMGVKAELGGGVTTRVLLKMRTAVDEGGESLEAFSQAAGLSADEFAAKFRNAPVEALDLVSKGIHRVNEAGGNVTAMLGGLGLKGTEEVQVMLALANSGDLLTKSLDLGAKSWEENTALVDEANKRYETAASKIKIAWNNIKDAAITAGGAILPVVADLADGVSKLVGWFGDLPEPVQIGLTALGGIAGAGALAAGGLMKIMSWMPGTVAGMKALGMDTPRATRAVSGIGKALGGITVVGAGLVAGKEVIEAINEAARSGKPDVEEYFNLIATGGDLKGALKLGESDGWTGSLFKDSGEQAKKYYETVTVEAGNAKRAIEAISTMDSFGGFTGWIQKNLSFGDVRGATEDALQLQEAMRGIARAFEMGENDLGQKSLAGLAKQLELTDEEVGTLINSVPELKDALTQIATDQGIQLDPNDDLALVDIALGRVKVSAPEAKGALEDLSGGFEETAASAEDAQKKIDDFYDNLVNKGMVLLGERESLRALQESFDDAAESLEKNGRTLDTNTEKGRANQEALDNIAQASLRAMEAQRENGATTDEMAETLQNGRDEFVKYAEKMGMSTKEAEKLADQLNLIPGSVYIKFDSNTDSLAGKLTEIHELVKSTPNGKVTIQENSPAVIEALRTLGYIVTELPNGKIEVSETGTTESGEKIDKTAAKKRTAKINAEAITGAAEEQLAILERPRYSTLTVHTRYDDKGASTVSRGGAGGQTGNYMGGRVGSYKDGGKLPMTGLGRDMILGVSSDGRPIANVDDGEWVVNRRSADKYNGVIAAINADDPSVQYLAGYAGGGRPGIPVSNEAARHAASQSPGTVIDIGGITVSGVNDANAAARLVLDKVSSALAGQGVRIGKLGNP